MNSDSRARHPSNSGAHARCAMPACTRSAVYVMSGTTLVSPMPMCDDCIADQLLMRLMTKIHWPMNVDLLHSTA